MLLTRLTEHADQRSDLPPPYFRQRTMHWVIQLDATGLPLTRSLQRLTAYGDDDRIILDAPYVQRSGTRPPAFLLVDTAEYVLAKPKDESPKAHADATRKHENFRELVGQWTAEHPNDAVATAVARFFDDRSIQPIVPDEAEATDLVGIQVDGQWAHQQPSAAEFWARVVQERKSGSAHGLCLVCGNAGALLGTLPESVKGGAIPTGGSRGRDAQVVSINKAAQGRGGTLQLVNTPICDRCGNRSIATLNALLADRTHRYRWDDAVLVWWLREPVETDFLSDLLDQPPNARDLAKYLQQLTTSHTGARSCSGPRDNAFYGLTLSANQSRVVVRDWIDMPVAQVEARVARWFDDQRVTEQWDDGERVFPIWRLALCAGQHRDGQYVSTTIPHGLQRQLFAAAIRDTSLPSHILPQLLQRIRADAHVDAVRMAMLRLLLRRNTTHAQENTMPGLDPDAPDAAYQCGRTFAVLEALQKRAARRDGTTVNTTITDRLFRRAVVSPRSALVPARKTASGHLRKLRSLSAGPKDQAAGAALEARLDEVFDRTLELPAVLDLAGQARFLLGYHHQRAHDMAAARRARAADETDEINTELETTDETV